MKNNTTANSEHKARGPTARWLARFLTAVGERLFAADDQTAAQHGWQITARQGGAGRSYRDPRFDGEGRSR